VINYTLETLNIKKIMSSIIIQKLYKIAEVNNFFSKLSEKEVMEAVALASIDEGIGNYNSHLLICNYYKFKLKKLSKIKEEEIKAELDNTVKALKAIPKKKRHLKLFLIEARTLNYQKNPLIVSILDKLAVFLENCKSFKMYKDYTVVFEMEQDDDEEMISSVDLAKLIGLLSIDLDSYDMDNSSCNYLVAIINEGLQI